MQRFFSLTTVIIAAFSLLTSAAEDRSETRYSVQAYIMYPQAWGAEKRRLELTDTITEPHRINIYYTKEYFHLPEALPAQLQDTSRAGDTLQLAGGSGYLKKKEIMMAYDKRGYISVFANYGCPNCPISPYEHPYEYDASNRPVKITNVIGKHEEYVLVYDPPGNLKSVERLENGKVIHRVVYEVMPLSK
jgi:hypothetical protein